MPVVFNVALSGKRTTHLQFGRNLWEEKSEISEGRNSPVEIAAQRRPTIPRRCPHECFTLFASHRIPGLAAISYDCGSIGRALLFEGASHSIGLPTSDEMQPALPERCERLRNTMFGLPKTPAEGNERLGGMWEFDMALDQLAANGKPTYEP